MNKTKEIISLDDIKKLVDTFYGKVRKDELIGPVFDERIHDRWPQHLEKM
jgi:hemoglobin